MSQRNNRGRGRGDKNNQGTTPNNQSRGGSNLAQTPKSKPQPQTPGINSSVKQQFESFFDSSAPKTDKGQKIVKAETQKIDHGHQLEDEAIEIVYHDQQEAKKPAKFINKSKSIRDKDQNMKNLNNQDGFGGDARGNGNDQAHEQNNQRGGRFKERELTKASGSWVNNNGNGNQRINRNLKNTTLGDLENDDDGQHFDQFANKKSTYSESLYTSQKPSMNSLSNMQIQEAERVSREIENKDANGNIHLAEERGQVQQRDNDNEELMFSGVHRQGGGNNKNINTPKYNNRKNKDPYQNKKKGAAAAPVQLKNKKKMSFVHQKENVNSSANTDSTFVSTLDEKANAVFQQRRQGKAESSSLLNADNWKDYEHGHLSPDQVSNHFDDPKSKPLYNNVKQRGGGYGGQRGGHNSQYNNQGNYHNNRDNHQQRGSNNYHQNHNNRQQNQQQQYGYKPYSQGHKQNTYGSEPAQADNGTNGSTGGAQAPPQQLQYNSQPFIFNKASTQQPQTPTQSTSQQAPGHVAKSQAFFPGGGQNTSDNTGKQAQQQQPSSGMSLDTAKNFVPKQAGHNSQAPNMLSDNSQAQNVNHGYQQKQNYSGNQQQQFHNKHQNNGGQMGYYNQGNRQNQNAQNGYDNSYQNRSKPGYGYGSYEHNNRDNQYQQNGNQMQNNYSNNSNQSHGMDGSNGGNFNHVNNGQNFNHQNQQNNQHNHQPYHRSHTMPNYAAGNVGQGQAHPGWQQYSSNSFQPPYAQQFDNGQSMNNGQGSYHNQQHRFSQNSQGQPHQQFSTAAPSFQPSPQGNASQPAAQPASQADGAPQALKLAAQEFRPKEN